MIIHDTVNLLIANFGKELTEINISSEVVFATINQEASALWGLLLFGGYLSVNRHFAPRECSRNCVKSKKPLKLIRKYLTTLSEKGYGFSDKKIKNNASSE